MLQDFRFHCLNDYSEKKVLTSRFTSNLYDITESAITSSYVMAFYSVGQLC